MEDHLHMFFHENCSTLFCHENIEFKNLQIGWPALLINDNFGQFMNSK